MQTARPRWRHWQHLHSVHLGQVEVQQYKVVPLCRQCLQCGFAICTGIHLPKVDGMQVLRSLRQHDLETCVLI